ncbi:uncharacterized protein LOC111460674 isoform X3 [Cucurbita moschata]|uniref:Uncharacterized protein LOC111460674 isoform X3 n=1 Tax=Cucurbita moschata TaxID=3662 RepID=A0A6J1H6L3_CUCMO|nr:uncharacterized protein LOC111460674 isoform X3 [Cucurbita moschata]
MEAEGQKTATNPSAMLAGLLTRRAKLHDELRTIEKQVYDMETNYLQDPSQCGNVLKGFEGFLSASKSSALLKSLQLDEMMGDPTWVLADLKVEAYIPMDKGNQKREDRPRGMQRECDIQASKISTMTMIRT